MRKPALRSLFLLSCLLLVTLVPPLTGQSRDALPVPDILGYKTLKCDFHMHTVFSDGEVWPTTRVTEAWRDGFDVISITDHAGYNPHKEDVKPDLTRGQTLAQPLADRLGILLVPGVEVAEGNTHCNLLFVKDPNAFMGLKLLDALREGRTQNAIAFWNHPGWKETPRWFPLIASAHDEGLLHGIELVNGDTFYSEAFPWVEEKKLAIYSNSDIHAPVLPQYGSRSRPVTLVFVRTADLDGVREALSARRSAAWMGGEVWGPEAELKGLFEGSVTPEQPKVSVHSASRQAVLRLRNRSALSFDLRAIKTPAWLSAGNAKVRPESVAGLPLSIKPDAPAGTQSVELEFEIVNFHPAPDRHLRVRLSVEIERH